MDSASALSLEVRGRDLVNSIRSFSSSFATLYLVVDVLRVIIRMEFQDDKRKPVQQLPDDRKQVCLTDLSQVATNYICVTQSTALM